MKSAKFFALLTLIQIGTASLAMAACEYPQAEYLGSCRCEDGRRAYLQQACQVGLIQTGGVQYGWVGRGCYRISDDGIHYDAQIANKDELCGRRD